jgi:hypothetical protein
MKDLTVNVFSPTKPHAGQREVLDAIDNGSRFIMLRAGRKWRKTSLLISWLFKMAFKTKLTCPYVCPNRVQAKNIAWDDHITRLLTHFKEIGLPYKKNEVELSITLPTGGKVQLLGVENAESLRGISNWGAFAGDEVDDWELDIWPTIIRPNLMTNKAPAIMAGTPKGFRQLYGFEQSGIFKCFHFTSYDNPALDPLELESMVEEYKKLGEDYFSQEILAQYKKPVGLVYKEWNYETNYKDIEYDPNLPLHITWDFGVNDPTSIIWIQPNGAETRVIDYYEATDASIEHFVSVVQAKPYKKADLFTGDPAGKARTLTTGTSPIEILATKGINIRTKDGITIPDQIRQAHSKIPGLFVSKKAVGFKDCLLNYRYPAKSTTLVNQENEIPIHDKWSHAMRAFEYWAINCASGYQQENEAIYGENYYGINDGLKKKWSM